MRVNVDEDLPTDAVELLRSHCHEAESAIAEGMGGWKGLALWEAVQRVGRFLITADKGFGNILHYPPGTHHGVLLLRPDEDGVAPILVLLRSVLSGYRLESLAGIVANRPRGWVEAALAYQRGVPAGDRRPDRPLSSSSTLDALRGSLPAMEPYDVPPAVLCGE